MPNSVIRNDVDKDLTSVWYSVLTQSCFPNKEADRQKRVKQLILWGRLLQTIITTTTTTTTTQHQQLQTKQIHSFIHSTCSTEADLDD